MATFRGRVPPYKPGKDIPFDWNTFRGGLNTYLQDTAIAKNELAQTRNLMLTGAGAPTKRWGSAAYFTAGNATGSVRGLKGFYKSNATIELLALTDDGYLTVRNGSTFRTLTGASWGSGPSGVQVYMTQLNDNMYIVNGRRELVRYGNPTLTGFPTIAVPVITGASNISNATGSTIKSYQLTAVSQVGETAPSTRFELGAQPNELGGTNGGTIRLVWTGVSTASSILQGFNLYGRNSGNERFLAFIPGNATIYIDNGGAIPKEFTYPPTADSTGGPIAKYVKRFQDRLVFAGIDGEPSRVLISGRVPNHEKFDLANGGNYIDIEPDAGDDIVQIETFTDRILVFKERSIWEVKLTTEQIGNFFVTVPTLKLVTGSYGCIAPASVVPVDNDVFFLSRSGVRSLGYQQGYLADVLRTAEISVKIRPVFSSLTTMQKQNAVATYFDNKYIIAFPGKDEIYIFDRERIAWLGPWSLDSTVFETFYDNDNDEHLLFASEGGVSVDEFKESYVDDKGTAIDTILKTRNEDFGDWTLFKNIRNIFTQLRNVTGTVSVTIKLENRKGSAFTAKSFNITPSSGNSGWGADMWGQSEWGDTNAAPAGIDAAFTIRWANLNKLGRLMSLTFTTTERAADYELLGIRGDVRAVGRGIIPGIWRI